jgi:hypothetical protein
MSLRQLAALLALIALSDAAHAQVSRVFVSVNGNDANVCSNIATPCRTFGGGITQVDAQGEVIVVDSGSYAGTTITKSVKINVPAGIVAFSGLPITVDPGAGGVVVLRGLTLKAATPGAGIGITQNSGTLFLENTVVDGWSYGLYLNPPAPERLYVKGSVFRNNDIGVGINAGTSVEYAIDGSFFENNASRGVLTLSGTGRLSNSSMTGNGIGASFTNVGTVGNLQRCELSGNGIAGLSVNLGGVARVSESTIVRNAIGLRNLVMNPGTLESFGNNVVRGNTAETSGTITPVGLQ